MTTIHVLHHGLALCRFRSDIPGRWPLGQIWIHAQDLLATGMACLKPAGMKLCDGCLVIQLTREETRCQWCDEPIEMDDCFISTTWPDGPVMHHKCLVRSVVGSVGHQEKRCHCFVPGSTDDDPPGATKREAAKAAAELYKRTHPEQS